MVLAYRVCMATKLILKLLFILHYINTTRFPAPGPAVVVLAAIEIKNDIVNKTIKIVVLHTTHIIYCSYDKKTRL